MAAVVFTAGDQDYIEKLNTMSQQAGDVQQARTDAQQSVSDSQDEVTLAAEQVALAEEQVALAVAAKDLAQAALLQNVNGTNPDFASVRVAGVHVAKEDDINNMDNTSDMDKPVSTAQRAAIDESILIALGVR